MIPTPEVLGDMMKAINRLKLNDTALVISIIVAIWAGPIALIKVTVLIGTIPYPTILILSSLLSLLTFVTGLFARNNKLIDNVSKAIKDIDVMHATLQEYEARLSKVTDHLISEKSARQADRPKQEQFEPQSP